MEHSLLSLLDAGSYDTLKLLAKKRKESIGQTLRYIVKQAATHPTGHHVVETTSDYDKFKELNGNRPVETARVNKIIESIKKIGYITNPLIVNEKFEVIDGQGRLAALKKLRLPVQYLVHRGAGVDECVAMNIHQTNWSIMDYIRSYADRGDSEYKDLLKLIGQFSEIPMQVILAVARDLSTYSTKTTMIKNGQFNFVISYEDAENELRCLQGFSCIDYSGDKRVFFSAIHFIYRRNTVDMDFLKQRLINNRQKMIPFSTVDECLRSISEVYNFRLSGKNKVYWDSDYKRSLVESRKSDA